MQRIPQCGEPRPVSLLVGASLRISAARKRTRPRGSRQEPKSTLPRWDCARGSVIGTRAVSVTLHLGPVGCRGAFFPRRIRLLVDRVGPGHSLRRLGHSMEEKRIYDFRIVEWQVFTPEEQERIHMQLLTSESVEASDATRKLILEQWPELAHKLAPKRPPG
jgi:hypothetical protein